LAKSQPEPTGENSVGRVVARQAQDITQLSDAASDAACAIHVAVDAAKAQLTSLGIESPSRSLTMQEMSPTSGELRGWDELAEEAKEVREDFEALLKDEGIERARQRIHQIGEAALIDNRLDRYDYCIAGVAGVLAGLVDIILVRVPKHPGFLGSHPDEGGWLSNEVKKIVGDILPEQTVRRLERDFPVSFDPSTNTILARAVPGLGPRTHRFQSLGHDPILGWIFGVADVLRDTFTAIGKDGTLVIQTTTTISPDAGQEFFVRVAEALRIVGGHLLSDASTPAGLPAPLMPLASFLQFGTIGKQGYSVGEVARQMYRSGYDFRHFLAGSLSVAIIEVIVRASWVIRRLQDGCSLVDALPGAGNPRLGRSLFIAHAASSAMNAGKVVVSQTPLSLNWGQWLMFFRYLLPEMDRILGGDAKLRQQAIDRQLTTDWRKLLEQIDQTASTKNEPVVRL
jgi:hypothetical protein